MHNLMQLLKLYSLSLTIFLCGLNSIFLISPRACLAETTWQTVGPFGGDVRKIVITQADTQILFALTTNNGLFISRNGGAGWSAAKSGFTSSSVTAVATDPANPNIVYTGTPDGVFKSNDGGTSWSLSSAGMTNLSVNALAVDPQNPLLVYAATGGGVFKSMDAGSNWISVSTGLTNLVVTSLIIDPKNTQTLYTSAKDGIVFKSSNRAESWSVVNSTAYSFGTSSFLLLDPVATEQVYVVTQSSSRSGNSVSVAKSANGGGSWTSVKTGMDTVKSIYSFTIDPTNPQLIYAATDLGLYRSNNGAASWSAVSIGASNKSIAFLEIDPKDPRIYYSVMNGGNMYKSLDKGLNWVGVNTGMTSSSVSSLVMDPSNHQTLYAGTTVGVFKTIDAGATWGTASIGMADYSIKNLLIDPVSPATIYAVTGYSKLVGMVSTMFGTIYKSTDGGQSWAAVKTTSGASGFYFLAMDPGNTKILYTATYSGVLKSVDGGATWSAVSMAGTSVSTFSAFAIASTSPQTLYGVTAAAAKTSSGNLVFKSTDGGVNWTSAVSGIPAGTTISSFIIQPKNPQILYAMTSGGLFKSSDSGSNWNCITADTIANLTFDQNSQQTLYASRSTGVMITSADGGMNWTPLGSIQPLNSSVSSILADSLETTIVYAATSGGIYKLINSGAPSIIAPVVAAFTVGTAGSFKVSTAGWPAATLSVVGSLPSGLTFNPQTGVVSGTPQLGSSGIHTILFTADNGLPPSASRGVRIVISDSSLLSATVTSPPNNSTIATKPAAISGTAAGGALNLVEIQITDGTYYLQSDGTFNTTAAWLAASGTANWSFPTQSTTWSEGVSYTILARANSGKISTASFKIQSASSKQPVLLAASFAPNELKAGDSAVLNGILTKSDATGLSDQNIVVVITPPSTPLVPIPTPIINTIKTDSNGNFTTGMLSSFASPGIYTVQIRYNGSDIYQSAIQSLSLPAVAHSGYAIIVVGKAADNSLLNQHTSTATTIYNMLITKRGFLNSNIKTLVSTTGSAVTKQQIQDALNQIKSSYTAAPAPVYIIMIDHGIGGTVGGFVLGDTTDLNVLKPTELANMLDNFESGFNADVLNNNPRFLIVGSCYSGQFQALSKNNGRIIITSSAADELSLAGAISYDGALSGGDYFIDKLFSYLGRGNSFKTAYNYAVTDVKMRDPRTYPLALHSGVVDTLAQHPLLDDNGDGSASYGESGGNDGIRSSTQYLGEGTRITAGASPSDIMSAGVVSGSILESSTVSATFQLSARDNSRVKRVWMEIRPPGIITSGNSGTGQFVPGNLDYMQLTYDGVKWTGTYEKFIAAGRYDIYFYSRDILTDDISPVAHQVIYKKKSANNAPVKFDLISPLPLQQASVEPSFVVEWQPSSDNDGLTYTLEISTDNFNTIAYSESDLVQTMKLLQAGKLSSPLQPGGYICQNNISYCQWRVKAIDGFGEITTSTSSGSFSIVTTNALPSIVTGYITTTEGIPIPGAVVTIGSSQVATLSNGAFLSILQPGTYTLTASASGYLSKNLVNQQTSSGKVLVTNFKLLTPSEKPGDCDGDGTVTIAEVQSAINMFLGLKSVAGCVDTDRSKNVSIAEVQKTINSFLGL